MKKYLLTILLMASSCSSFKSPQENLSNSNLVKIAVVNFRVEGNSNLKDHLMRIEKFVKTAKEKGASYLLLPELIVFDLLPLNPTKEEVKTHLRQLAERAVDYEVGISEIGKKWKLGIIGASLVVKEKGHFYNRGLYVTSQGMVHYQDKIQPTPWEKEYDFKGKSQLKIFKTDKFSFAILICHDAEFPDISSKLIKDKPEIVFVPSQTGSLAGLRRVKYTSMARAIEHMAFVLMTGVSGDPNAAWHSYVGQNFLFTPQNKLFDGKKMRGPHNQEALSIFDLNLDSLRKGRLDNQQIYPARDAKNISVKLE